MSNFNCCFVVWNFSSAQSLNRLKNIQKNAWHFLLNDYGSTYEDLLEKSGCFKNLFIYMKIGIYF